MAATRTVTLVMRADYADAVAAGDKVAASNNKIAASAHNIQTGMLASERAALASYGKIARKAQATFEKTMASGHGTIGSWATATIRLSEVQQDLAAQEAVIREQVAQRRIMAANVAEIQRRDALTQAAEQRTQAKRREEIQFNIQASRDDSEMHEANAAKAKADKDANDQRVFLMNQAIRKRVGQGVLALA